MSGCLQVGSLLTVHAAVGQLELSGTATVLQAGPSSFRISWPRRGAVKLPLTIGKEVKIELPDPDGWCVFRTEVRGREGDEVLLTTPDPVAVTRLQRRLHPRERLVPPRPASVRPDPELGFTDTWAGTLVDVSRVGCQVHVESSAFEGLRVTLAAGTDPELAAGLRGEVVYCHSRAPGTGHVMGLRFLESEAVVRDYLTRALAEGVPLTI